jgi:hypothetical protein
LKFFAKFGFVIASQTLIVVLAHPALAEQGTTLTLKPVVQVAAAEVTLSDLVASGDMGSDENLIICHTPAIGSARTLRLSEIAAVLKKNDAVHPLQGPTQITVTRAGRKISADDLKPLIEAELKKGNKGTIQGIQLQAAIYVTDTNGIKLRRLRFDPAIDKYRAWFIASDAPHPVIFEAMATLDRVPHSDIEIKAQNQHVALPVLAHRGEPAAMELDGDGFSATLQVVCLEDGRASDLIRVHEQGSKHNYRAQVTGPGLLRAVSREN